MTKTDELMSLADECVAAAAREGFMPGGFESARYNLCAAIEQALAEARDEALNAANRMMRAAIRLEDEQAQPLTDDEIGEALSQLNEADDAVEAFRDIARIYGITTHNKEQPQPEPEEPLILAVYNGKDGHRQWASTGTWLYPGEALAQIKWAQKEKT